jgi:outer membrane protein assembly factor BamB
MVLESLRAVRRSRTGRIASAALLTLGCILALVDPIGAEEWTHWRGPTQNGVSGETGLISSWSPEGENLIWRADFIGRSTPVVVDGRVCVIGRRGEGVERQEVVACFDAGTGEKLWEDRFNPYLTTVPFNRVGWASMAADAETGLVYAHGVAGQLIAYDEDGTKVWERFLPEEFGRLSGYGGRTQTPLVEGDQLIINFVSVGWGELKPLRHRYLSFDKRTGELLWVSTPGSMAKDFNTQSSPVAATVHGRRVIVAGNADGSIYVMDVHSGEKIAEFPLSKRGINSSVLVEGNVVFASHSEENLDEGTMGRVVAIGVAEDGTTKELWRINELSAGFPTPTYKDGRLFVIDNSANLHSVDGGSGEVKWTQNVGTVGKGSPVWADGKLYVTETNGRFHILKPSAGGAELLDSDELKVAAEERYAEIYGSAAIAYGRIYFTTEDGIYCLGDKSAPFEVARTEAPPPPKGSGEAVTLQVVPGEVQLRTGELQQFRVRLLDARGGVLAERKASWSLDGLVGEVDASGKFTASGDDFQAGKVVAKVGDLTAAGRVRVYPPFPWSFDFQEYDEGGFPGWWIGANRIYLAGEKDGRKVLVKAPRARGLNRTYLYMGPSWPHDYTIEAEVMGTAQGRRRPDIGLINSGYILDLKGGHNSVEIRSWTAELRIHAESELTFEPDIWYRMKLRVEHGEDKNVIRGKVWKAADAEPEAWTVTAEDPLPIESGTPGLLAFSPVHVYYDHIKVYDNE